MATIVVDLQIAAILDNGTEDGVGILRTTAGNILVTSRVDTGMSAYKCTGLRFLNPDILLLSTIDAAYFSIHTPTTGDDANMDIYAHDVDSALDFDTVVNGGIPHVISTSTEPNGRPRTAASVEWVHITLGESLWHNSPSIVTVIQEWVDRLGRSSTSDLVLLLIAKDDASYTLFIDDYAKDSSLAAKLHIEYTENFPDTPTNSTPTNGAIGQSVVPTLICSAFSGLGSHLASQWQLSDTSGDYGSPVYDSGEDAVNLESVAVTNGLLLPGTTYYWRVRHQNEAGWSSYSTETSFTTAIFVGAQAVLKSSNRYHTAKLSPRDIDIKLPPRYDTIKQEGS